MRLANAVKRCGRLRKIRQVSGRRIKDLRVEQKKPNVWANLEGSKSPVALFHDALEASSDLLIFSDFSGHIHKIHINPTVVSLEQSQDWVGQNILDLLAEESVPKIKYHLDELKASAPGEVRVTEVNHIGGSEWGFPIRYSIMREGDRVLYVGRDLSAIGSVQQALVNTQLALEADYGSSRDYETRYRAVMEVTQEPLVLVNINTGHIEDINSRAAEMLGDSPERLRSSSFLSKFDDKDRPDSLDSVLSGASGNTAPEWLATGKASRRRLSIVMTPIRSAGTRYAVCRLEAEISDAAATDFLSNGLKRMFDEGVDAIVFADATGIIQKCNNSFLDLCDVASAADVENRPLSDFLSRGSIDQKMLIEGGMKSGQLRSYNTKVVTNYRSTLPVNVSATLLSDNKQRGFGFIIRIMRSVEAVPATDPPSVLASNQNVSKLVGASPLKEIVAGTADVIERICIETAIEMTGNNRVAAAEMLGLSRQSLYVKLRKFGILEKSDTP